MNSLLIKQKSSALLITMLIVSSLGLMALTMARSSILSLAATTKNSDSVIAEEASRGGLEYGLLQCKDPLAVSGSNYYIEYDTNAIQKVAFPSINSSHQYADVAVTYTDNFSDDGLTNTRTCTIDSTGHISNTYKKHQLKTDLTSTTPPPPLPPPLVASFSFSPLNPQVGNLVVFDGSASDGGTQPYTFNWNFGDGATGSGAGPSHPYAAVGPYTVTLTVTDSVGVSVIESKPLTISGVSPGTKTLWPNADDAWNCGAPSYNCWTPSPNDGVRYTKVNDNSDLTYITANFMGFPVRANYFQMENVPSGISKFTKIDVYAQGQSGNGIAQAAIRVRIGGVWSQLGTTNYGSRLYTPAGPFSKSAPIGGWSQTDLDNMELEVVFAGDFGSVNISQLYAVVTY